MVVLSSKWVHVPNTLPHREVLIDTGLVYVTKAEEMDVTARIQYTHAFKQAIVELTLRAP